MFFFTYFWSIRFSTHNTHELPAWGEESPQQDFITPGFYHTKILFHQDFTTPGFHYTRILLTCLQNAFSMGSHHGADWGKK